MKTNKDKILEYMIEVTQRLEGDEALFTTQQLAEIFPFGRANISTSLNQLVESGELVKINGRPVQYTLYKADDHIEKDAFSMMIGSDGSLKNAVRLAKAYIHYPEKNMRALIVGERGTGKNLLARKMYEYALENKLLDKDDKYIRIDAQDYRSEEEFVDAVYNMRTDNDESNHQTEMIFIDHMENLSGMSKALINELVNRNKYKNKSYNIICGIENPSQVAYLPKDISDNFAFQIQMPPLQGRPLSERLELVEDIFIQESEKVNKEIVINSELLRCFLLYKCEGNIAQLKSDIRLGCANAYVREVNSKHNKLNVYMSDCNANIRKGFLFYKENRNEIEKLIPENYTYSYNYKNGKKREENTWVSANKSVYESINEQVDELKQRGLAEEDIMNIVSANLESNLSNMTDSSYQGEYDKAALEKLIDSDIISMVDDLLKEATLKFKRIYPTSVFQALCFSVSDAINKKDSSTLHISNEKISEIISDYPDEYQFALRLSNKINNLYDIKLPLDQTVLFTIYLCNRSMERQRENKPEILIAMHGKVASSIAETINKLYQGRNVHYFDLLLDEDMNQAYEHLRSTCINLKNEAGLLIFYDMGSLKKLFEMISVETGIRMKMIEVPLTLLGLDAVMKFDTGETLDSVYSHLLESGFGTFTSLKSEYERMDNAQRNKIITVCMTGSGAAEQMRQYLEKHLTTTDIDIIPLAINDRKKLVDALSLQQKSGNILCIVGTYDPEIHGIPYIPVTKLFETPVDKLDMLVVSELLENDSAFDYTEMYQYLDEQLEYVNINRLKGMLHKAIRRIRREIRNIQMDEEVGLFMHIACAINHLLAKEEPLINVHKDNVINKHKRMYNELKDIFEPIEEEFEFRFTDNDIATIIEILE